MDFESFVVRPLSYMEMAANSEDVSPVFDIGGATELQALLKISSVSSTALTVTAQTSVDGMEWDTVTDGTSPFNFSGEKTAVGAYVFNARSQDGYNISRYLRFHYAQGTGTGKTTFELHAYVKK